MEGLTEVMFEQRLEGDEGGNSCIYIGESILGRRNSKCEGPEVELGLVCEGAMGKLPVYL